MTRNATDLIKSHKDRTLTAYGYKLLNTITEKAAKANGFNRYQKEFVPMKNRVRELVMSLVFDHNITAENLSKLNRLIKIKENGELSISTSEIFISKQ